MSRFDHPCLNLAIARLTYGQSQVTPSQPEHFAIWVVNAPYPSGYVHHDCVWPETLTQTWLAWREMFSLRGLPNVPLVHHAPKHSLTLPPEPQISGSGQMTNYTGRLMQHLGINLWQWLFDGPIQNSLFQSQGIAIGQNKPLRLRLEVRDPDLIAVPWEIMQSQAGKQAISLSQQNLFSRTTSDVDPLPPQRLAQTLNILLVLGQNNDPEASTNAVLKLEQEANTLVRILETCGQVDANEQNDYSINGDYCRPVKCRVDTLIQPTPAELINSLEVGAYNILFYAGHGIPAPDGGLLFLQPQATINGTELAQILVRCRVTLAVFNACWGAQPEQDRVTGKPLPRSSLAEVLIHHGVPAVLGMRDSIADREALSFIQTFAQALAMRKPIDLAVAIARQQLLTLYRFNQPAWTLPVLYMHPQFNGELLKPIEDNITELPGIPPTITLTAQAFLRSVGEMPRTWPLQGGIMRVGRLPDNDVVVLERWVSQRHAEIILRNSLNEDSSDSTYFLRDFSRFGTFLLSSRGWQNVHHQEVALSSGVQLKFGSLEGQIFEFIVESANNL